MRFKKGSPEAKAHMARLRAMVGRRSDPVQGVKDHFGFKKNPNFGGKIVHYGKVGNNAAFQIEKAILPISVYGEPEGLFVGTIFVGQVTQYTKASSSLAGAKAAAVKAIKDVQAGRTNPAPPRFLPAGATARRPRADKALDKQIEAAYYRVASGVQVSIMDIPKIFADARALIAGGRTDLDQVLIDVVKRYQTPVGGGRMLQNPPAYFIIDPETDKVLAIVRGHPAKTYPKSVEVAAAAARKLGHTVVHVVHPYVPPSLKVGSVVTKLFYSYGANWVDENGRVTRTNPKFKARFTADDMEQRETTLKAHGFNSALKKANRMAGKMPPKFTAPRSEVEVTRCNPRACRNPGHKHPRKNPMLQMVTLANPKAPACPQCDSKNTGSEYKGEWYCYDCGFQWAPRQTRTNPSSAAAIKARMVHVLKIVGEGMVDDEKSAEFDREAAIYWFAADHHKGQADPLYSILSTSQYKPGPGVRSVKGEGEIAEAFYRVLVQMSKKLLKNPLTRWEASQALKQARYRLDTARKPAFKGLRPFLAGEASGIASVVEGRGPAAAREVALKMARRASAVSRGMKKNPLSRGEVAETVLHAKDVARTAKRLIKAGDTSSGLRQTSFGRGMLDTAYRHTKGSAARGAIQRMMMRFESIETRKSSRMNPLRPAGVPYCHMCGNWSKAKGPYKPAPGNVGWMTGKAMCKLCREGATQLQAEGFDFNKKTAPHRVPKRGYHPNPAIPFKQGQTITVQQALDYARKTGNASLIKQCNEAIALCKKANGAATKVRFDLVAMGDPNKVESVMAGVEYGETDETVYKPTKGSKKGQHLYRHEWGEGSGRRKPVPLIAPVGGKALVMPLGKGQKATDWLRG